MEDKSALPIFIPSKGRAEGKRCTWHLLRESNLPHTIVVEPQEYEWYVKQLRGDSPSSSSLTSVVQLPENNKGVIYVRNYILRSLAPDSGWFWIIDDDIESFYALQQRDFKVVPVDARTALSLANPHDAVQVQPGTCLIGLEYHQFMGRLDFRRSEPYIVDSYVNICVCMNRALLPSGPQGEDLSYRFPIREDYDMCLQIIAQGGHVFRYRCVGFRAPAMGTKPGGMTEFYQKQKALIHACNLKMEQLWSPGICAECVKGSGKTQRKDLRINWSVVRERVSEAQKKDKSLMEVLGQTAGTEVNVKLITESAKRGREIFSQQNSISKTKKEEMSIKTQLKQQVKTKKKVPVAPGWKGWDMVDWYDTDLSIMGYAPLSEPCLGTSAWMRHTSGLIIPVVLVEIRPKRGTKKIAPSTENSPRHDVVVIPEKGVSVPETSFFVCQSRLFLKV